MKYVRQFGIILGITFIGEILNSIVPLPIPASIYGLVLMLILLVTGVIRLEQIKETGVFLIEIMPMMFIPAAVGLMVSWQSLESILLQVIVITLISTVLVMVVAGKITQWIVYRKEGHQDERDVI
ncbi:CidA/LrgA family protein [Cellulosilyticum sp. ST5]|uniref:LrgA family protein n=1 Tax=Cellulosilyticum lentocellum (strain ATCC 49066 / DSM 5427 / NCIMB 11756 / RHM5) TaxID=642492 RepID=F2JJ98_CELLD|nr:MULTISPECIES: CidA/LrgA family protein [Cellulosilyticum]ADZ84391.1 LrgA family protein [Cellulosilyticum lentocellum DSM 5427]QEH69862.1 CidA/LrgA family protein [Cellulosilyticum sp. WCF-2]